MGCWKETCMVTQYPITAGDPVVGFILKESDYVSGVYRPVSLPIFGNYDDYGNIEDIEEDSITTKMYTDANTEITEGAIQLGDDDHYTGEINTLLGYMRCVERGLLTDTSKELVGVDDDGKPIHESRTMHYALVMVHRRVYDAWVKEVGDRLAYGEDFTYASNVTEKLQEPKESGMFPRWNGFQDRLRSCDALGDWITTYLEDIQSGDELTLSRVTSMVLFNRAMGLSRRSWAPQEGAGSQCSEMQLHIIAGDVMKQYATEQKDLWYEENIPEEGDVEEDFHKEVLWSL